MGFTTKSPCESTMWRRGFRNRSEGSFGMPKLDAAAEALIAEVVTGVKMSKKDEEHFEPLHEKLKWDSIKRGLYHAKQMYP